MKEIENPDGDVKIFAGGKTNIFTFEESIPNGNIVNIPAVLVQSRGMIDVIYYENKFTFKNEMWAYTHENKITVKYLFYFLKTKIPQFMNIASSKGSFPQISLEVTEELEIPNPSLEVQKYIVEILDKFHNLINDITQGLPKEIELREKQYIYYREKLLDFKK